jgi:hypothetical protein
MPCGNISFVFCSEHARDPSTIFQRIHKIASHTLMKCFMHLHYTSLSSAGTHLLVIITWTIADPQFLDAWGGKLQGLKELCLCQLPVSCFDNVLHSNVTISQPAGTVVVTYKEQPPQCFQTQIFVQIIGLGTSLVLFQCGFPDSCQCLP